MKTKITLGISSCLLGKKVKWNGDHNQDRYIKNILGNYFDYISVCPEVGAGMGAPREPVALYGDKNNPKMIGRKSRMEWTDKMELFTKDQLKKLSNENLCGFIFKSKSPSCGVEKIPVFSETDANKTKYGNGLFARAFINKFPTIPIEDESRLHDNRIKENFIIKVFSFYRLKTMLFKEHAKPSNLVEFHTQNKFLLLAHSRKHYQALGRIVANMKLQPFKKMIVSYSSLFMEALTFKTTNKKNTDVLLHMIGFFKTIIPKEDKKDVLAIIEDYRQGIIPLIVPITLMKHYVKKYKIRYLQNQFYLSPHPEELMLRYYI